MLGRGVGAVGGVAILVSCSSVPFPCFLCACECKLFLLLKFDMKMIVRNELE